jgi:Replication-relaxation
LEHSLQIADFRALLTAALRIVPGMTLHSWVAEGQLRHDVVLEGPQHRTVVASVIPDSSFILERPRPGGDIPLKAHFFLEADRSTESGRTRFVQKVKAYARLWESGLYQETYGRAMFRVLTLARTLERRDNLRRATQSLAKSSDDPVLSLFSFGCVTDYTLDDPATLLGPIWRSAKPGDEAFHRLLE